MIFRKLALLTLMISPAVAIHAHAQTSTTEVPGSTLSNPLDQLYPGYQATIFENEAEVRKVFDGMATGFTSSGFLRSGSQCFNRAQVWSYSLANGRYTTSEGDWKITPKKVNAMKVFVFYTHTYKKECEKLKGKECKWWFHVAPYVIQKTPDGNGLTERVLDPSFAYLKNNRSNYASKNDWFASGAPLTMREWTDIFVETHRACKENVPFSNFRNEVEVGADGVFGTEHCYIVRVPGTDYEIPDVDARTAGIKKNFDFDRTAVSEAIDQGVIGRLQKDYYRALGVPKKIKK